MPQGVQGVR
jgi:hypothetical protein